MSAQHQHQNAQERHTNIAIVRLKKGGKKFEVAAYPNKVLSWRQGIETDLDEVLQKTTVFDNVSRGIHAKKSDMAKAFGTDDLLECCKLILAQGDVQVGEKEREMEYSSKFRDIATMVANRCVNAQTGWPFTVATIETAMKDTIHFAVNPAKPTKQQATEVIERLKEHMPITRARIHVKLSSKSLDPQAALKIAGEKSEITSSGDGWVGLLADPSQFKSLEQHAKSIEGTLVILQFSEISKSKDVDLDDMAMLNISGTGNTDARQDSTSGNPNSTTAPTTTQSSTGTSGGGGGVRCTSCDVTFGDDRQAQRAHYKTDFHTFNVKLKATGLPTVTAIEFENMSDQDKHAVLFDWKSS
jgi:ribosome maturation protein SDO1